MQNKLINLVFTLTSLFLSLTMIQACSFPGVFKINIQQGNIITQEMLDTLQPGMTRKQVHFVLGTPVLDNTFNTSIENYLYTYQKANEATEQQTVTVYYENDIYQRFEGHLLDDNPAY